MKHVTDALHCKAITLREGGRVALVNGRGGTVLRVSHETPGAPPMILIRDDDGMRRALEISEIVL